MREFFRIPSLALLLVFALFTRCPSPSGTDVSRENGDLALLSALLLTSSQTCTSGGPATPSDLLICGDWSDTSDGNAKYTITNSLYNHIEYLGTTTPRSDYEMAIVYYDNNTRILKLSGLQLDYSAWPTITTLGNTIYERIRFAVTDANTFYYCIESYNKNSLAELDADPAAYQFTGPADATCGGFTWSKMVRR